MAGAGGLVTLLRRDIRAAYRLGPWQPGSPNITPLLPVWASSSATWCMICCLVGLFFCLQPGGPWVEVWTGSGPRLSAVYGYQTHYGLGLGAAGVFLVLFLWVFAIGRMTISALWHAIPAMVAGVAAFAITLEALGDIHGPGDLLPAEVVRRYPPDQLHLILDASLYWVLAMSVALVLLGTWQLRGVLAARGPRQVSNA
ncbi:MAG TPA: hypothetical protein VFA18_08130 [Gemmataceae bacterium]|nr:hypothetical protein [Gemmataceae bacterium]